MNNNYNSINLNVAEKSRQLQLENQRLIEELKTYRNSNLKNLTLHIVFGIYVNLIFSITLFMVYFGGNINYYIKSIVYISSLITFFSFFEVKFKTEGCVFNTLNKYIRYDMSDIKYTIRRNKEHIKIYKQGRDLTPSEKVFWDIKR